MQEKNSPQNPAEESKKSLHFLTPSEEYIVKALGPDQLKVVVAESVDYAKNWIKIMMERDTYNDAYKMLYKQDIVGGMCSNKIYADELAW